MRRAAILLLCCVKVAAHAPVLPSIVGPLETCGNLLIDTGTGQTVLLRGVSATEFGVIRVRWNMNTVRLPVSFAAWRQDPDRMFATVRSANDAGLFVVLAANETGADAATFWSAVATRFKDNPRVMFSLFPTGREALQALVDAIRATGARQVIAASEILVGANLIYEAHPSLLSNAALDTLFGSVASRAPVYAGEWGSGMVTAEAVVGALTYFENRQISWTVNESTANLESVLLWTTGDPGGFGVLRPDFIANSAGGAPGPMAPGELLTLYTEQLGPPSGVAAKLGSDGKLPVNLEGTEVLFDGVPVPLLFAGAFQINVQVPYELRPGTKTAIQAFYRGIPSNRIEADVAESAPELFQDFATRYALALNEDGSRNGPSRPSRPGGILVLYASGGGQTAPGGLTGVPAPAPHPRLTLPVGVTVDGREAEVLFAGEVPGNVGLVQVNAKLPASLAGALRPVPVVLRVGGRSSQAPVLVWLAQ
jgi:uncharacterized protein (TIGR03437 family)